MKKQKLKEIFDKHIAPALELSKENSKITDGMHESIAKKHREFADLSEEEQRLMVARGEI